jgi:DEAD/DEAH box helicase domain-containing protein
LVASSAPLDQYIIEHPEYFFDRPAEHAQVNPEQSGNPDRPSEVRGVRIADPRRGAVRRTGYGELCRFLEDLKLLHHSAATWHWTSESYPADAVSLRAVSSDNFVVVDITGDHQVIAEVSFPNALTTLP